MGASISQSTILALIARGHAMEHKPDAYIGDVHGLQVDLNTRDASGGADDTREGTVIGGDVLSIRKQPLPSPKIYDNDTHRVYFNDMQLHYMLNKCGGCMTNIGLMKVLLESFSLKLVCILKI